MNHEAMIMENLTVFMLLTYIPVTLLLFILTCDFKRILGKNQASILGLSQITWKYAEMATALLIPTLP